MAYSFSLVGDSLWCGCTTVRWTCHLPQGIWADSSPRLLAPQLLGTFLGGGVACGQEVSFLRDKCLGDRWKLRQSSRARFLWKPAKPFCRVTNCFIFPPEMWEQPAFSAPSVGFGLSSSVPPTGVCRHSSQQKGLAVWGVCLPFV